MAKKFVFSWDVFDTLITRRCVHPDRIFELMGGTLGGAFKAERVQAERSAREAKQEISIEDIYDQLQISFGWTDKERRKALDLEIRLEFENVIPISENISKVRDGDIVVSDMYLPHEIIMRLLQAAGLDKEVTLFVSNNGKAQGSIWSRLKTQFYIIKHTGDNPRSDVLRPLLHGIPTRLSEASLETEWERILRSNGAPELSSFVREMRLRIIHNNKALSAVQKAQIEANFPMLLLASAGLVQWCKQNKVSHALMSSRDCVLWTQLAEKVARHAASDLIVEYFLTSRVASLKSSEEYLKYASKRIMPYSVVVDLSMTGVSLAGLADRLGIKEVRAFVIAWQQSIAHKLYGEKFKPIAKVNIEFITAEVIKEDLEAINQALTPSIHDVHETKDGISISYTSENRDAKVLAAVQVQNNTFVELIDRIPHAVLDESIKLAASSRLVFLIRESARHSGKFKTVISKAQPGAALWNDPNGIKLNLPYARQTSFLMLPISVMKRMLRPVIPSGSYLHRHVKMLILIIQIIMNKSNKN